MAIGQSCFFAPVCVALGQADLESFSSNASRIVGGRKDPALFASYGQNVQLQGGPQRHPGRRRPRAGPGYSNDIMKMPTLGSNIITIMWASLVGRNIPLSPSNVDTTAIRIVPFFVQIFARLL